MTGSKKLAAPPQPAASKLADTMPQEGGSYVRLANGELQRANLAEVDETSSDAATNQPEA